MGHVLLTRPGHFDGRSLHGHGGVHCGLDEIRFQSPSEAAAHVRRVRLDVRTGNTRDPRAHRQHHRGKLGAGPDVQPAVPQQGDRAQGLHRGVRQIGNPILALEERGFGQHSVDVAFIARPANVAVFERLLNRPAVIGTGIRIGSGTPVELDRFCGLEGVPGVGGHDDDARLDRDDPLNARHPLGLRGIESAHDASQARVAPHDAMKHAGQPHVDRVLGSTGAFGEHVDAW